MKLYANISAKELKEILKTPKELSGLARVKQVGSQGFYLYDFNILSSFNKFSFTSLTIDDLDKFFRGLIKKGISTNDFLVWWHTHPLGPVGFSLYDEQTIDTVLDDSDYFISIVFTHNLEFAGRLTMFKPKKLSADLEVVLCDKNLNPRNIIREVNKCKYNMEYFDNSSHTLGEMIGTFADPIHLLGFDERRGYVRDVISGEDLISDITDTKV